MWWPRTMFERFWPRWLRRQWMVAGYQPWSRSQTRRMAALIGHDPETMDQGRTPVGEKYFWTKHYADRWADAITRVNFATKSPVEIETERRFP